MQDKKLSEFPLLRGFTVLQPTSGNIVGKQQQKTNRTS